MLGEASLSSSAICIIRPPNADTSSSNSPVPASSSSSAVSFAPRTREPSTPSAMGDASTRSSIVSGKIWGTQGEEGGGIMVQDWRSCVGAV